MVFPLIPLLALASILGGSFTLYWYSNLSEEEKKRADAQANDYALTLFGKSLEQLSAAEARRVHALVKSHWN